MAKILVADDAEFMRVTMKNILEKAGYEVITAVNGEDAYLIYCKEHPDVVIMDIVMPIMNGLESLMYIKKYDKYANVLMCSPIGQQDMIMQALKSGARDYILKPFVAEKVLHAVESVLIKESQRVVW